MVGSLTTLHESRKLQKMTPEEWAARAVPPDFTKRSLAELRDEVVAVIREAVATERTACARLAAVMGMPRDSGELGANVQPEQLATARLAARIAQAIEARATI
jgi:hypothetical protein